MKLAKKTRQNEYEVKQNKKTLQAFLDYIQVFDWMPECAETAGKLRAHLQQKGNLIGPYDLLIAAHSLALKTTLVTNNTSEFKRVPKLKITDWIHS